MKVGIVGGGISGLYLASRLTQAGHTVDVYEESKTVGGRIKTCNELIDKTNIQYEAGAGRFNKSHKRLIKLKKEFHLFDKIKPNNSQRTYQVNSRKFNYEHLVYKTLFTDVLHQKADMNHDLKSITLQEHMDKVVGKRVTKQIINAFFSHRMRHCTFKH